MDEGKKKKLWILYFTKFYKMHQSYDFLVITYGLMIII